MGDDKNNEAGNYRFNLAFVAIAFLVLSALHIMPYAFYQITRLVVFGLAAYLSYMAYAENNRLSIWVFVFAFAALIFNPIIKMYFTVDTWHSIDFLSAAAFFVFWIVKNRVLLVKDSKHS